MNNITNLGFKEDPKYMYFYDDPNFASTRFFHRIGRNGWAGWLKQVWIKIPWKNEYNWGPPNGVDPKYMPDCVYYNDGTAISREEAIDVIKAANENNDDADNSDTKEPMMSTDPPPKTRQQVSLFGSGNEPTESTTKKEAVWFEKVKIFLINLFNDPFKRNLLIGAGLIALIAIIVGVSDFSKVKEKIESLTMKHRFS